MRALRISLASPEQIRSWSSGEVTKAATVNYSTLKPERGGLFCERIFGPTQNYECSCGKYKGKQFQSVICDRCGVEVTCSEVRRSRMGHVELAAPVSHIWFAKGNPVHPSPLELLLNLSWTDLERVLYYSHYIVTSIDEEVHQATIENIQKEVAKSRSELAFKENYENLDVNKAEIGIVKSLRVGRLLTHTEYRELSIKYPSMFDCGMGAEAILRIIKGINLQDLRQELIADGQSPSEERRRKSARRLQVVEEFLRSGNKPEWMILTVLPVLPPDLRPATRLKGGHIAISDINQFYLGVINSNNRLRHFIETGAPEVIIHNEKRLLQEAIDALIANGKRGKTSIRAGGRKLASFSDKLNGKEGFLRRNMLGKRVDYSGRSVIVVGPDLKLRQCGLSTGMALELFKPFVIERLIAKGLAYGKGSALRLIKTAQPKPEVYDILEEVVKERPVLLNRAPTLHRLGIQAFEPVLIDGDAIQIHPLVCAGFNADFDGDTMSVHIPVSEYAVKEAKETMLSIHNMLLPASGDPAMTPTMDIVLGCYYLTSIRQDAIGPGRLFGSFEEASLAFELGAIDLRSEIEVRDTKGGGQRLKTTAGRIIFNDCFPSVIGYRNYTINKSALKKIVADCIKVLNDEEMANVLDRIKEIGFKYATQSGTTIAMSDLKVPEVKAKLVSETKTKAIKIEKQYENGLVTKSKRRRELVKIWTDTTDKVTDATQESLDQLGGIYMMATSGTRGDLTQIAQIVGMRGLMNSPSGEIKASPIIASFKEGLNAMEFFTSLFGALKGGVDKVLGTPESGYLTRRLVNAAQDVIISVIDCGTVNGIWINDTEEPNEKELLLSFKERIVGRLAAVDIADSKTGDIIVARNEEIDETKAAKIVAVGVKQVCVRSPLTCAATHGICQKCYGRDLARGKIVNLNTAVGIIAAQSIGEPGTQLTLRTFHTGGVASAPDITAGLPRVAELFEARTPKYQAILSETAGTVEVKQIQKKRIVKVTNHENKDERFYKVSARTRLYAQSGDMVKTGQPLTEGLPNPKDILSILGKNEVQRYLVDEIQKVYRSNGVNINNKHIETIIRQMLAKVRVNSSGDTELVLGELLDWHRFAEVNVKVKEKGGEPAEGHNVLLGITSVAQNSGSWLASASFRSATIVLADAAIKGSTDNLVGLAENIMVGQLIPARCES